MAESEHAPAARTAQACDPRQAVGVVVVGQLLAFPDPSGRQDPDGLPDHVGIAVRIAGVVDIARDVPADGGIARAPVVDDEDPDAVARQIALLPAPRFALRDELALVLDDSGV